MPTCRAKFVNKTSNTTITKTLAVFYFDDGTQQADPKDGPGDVECNPGEATYRFTSYENRDKCVNQIYFFLVWTNGSQDLRNTKVSGECYTQDGVVLSQKSLVSRSLAESAVQVFLLDPSTEEIRPAELDDTSSVPAVVEEYFKKIRGEQG